MNPQANTPQFAQAPRSLIGRIAASLIGIGLLVLGFMFSLFALAVLAIGGALFAGWFWWKTRALRKAMRESAPAGAAPRPTAGDFIDGECVREAPAERLLR